MTKWWLGNWRIITEDEVLAGAIGQGGEGAFDLVQVVGGRAEFWPCHDLVVGAAVPSMSGSRQMGLGWGMWQVLDAHERSMRAPQQCGRVRTMCFCP